MNITIVTNHDGKSGIGILENIDFLINIRNLIRGFVDGRVKKIRATAEYFEKNQEIKHDLSEPMFEYLSGLTQLITTALETVEDGISVENGYIKSLFKERNSFLLIKVHLILQALLWLYIETKLPKLPKQHQSWSFSQILDLADTFNEIPKRVMSYCSSLNEMRNKIAHRPKAFEFANIKQKHKALIYKKNGCLFGIQEEPSDDQEIFDDWINSFLIATIVFGCLISTKNFEGK